MWELATEARIPATRTGAGIRSPVWAIVAFAAAALLGCTSSPDRPNIVLVTVDTLRADRLGPYGYEKVETPAIARLAREGVLFENAFADASWTLPSLSSVMTGKYPTRHLVRTWNDRLHPDHRTLAEILKDHGYATAAIVGSYPLDRFFGLARGFDYYDDEMTTALYEKRPGDDAPPPTQSRPNPETTSPQERAAWQKNRELHNAYRSDDDVADEAIGWLERNRGAPFFLWVHFFGPHERGKRQFLDAEARKRMVAAQAARYDSDVEEMDRQVGRFLEELRRDHRFPTTAVVFHSDHGQSLLEHGTFGHGFDLYDTSVHVPLIVRLPYGKRAGERVRELVRNLDIFATVVDLARADADLFDSRHLLGSRPATDNHVYMETHHELAFTTKHVEVGEQRRRVGRTLRGIRTDRHKLIVQQPTLAAGEERGDPLPEDFVADGSKVFLFDVTEDTGEHRDLTDNRVDQVTVLRGVLDGHQDEAGRQVADPVDLGEDAKERLRSLGYLP
jgi:arylsulfatase A-like enzyme